MQRCLAAVAAAVPKNSSVLELYAGSGVIGLSLAAAGVARRVVCVEINPAATQSFRASAAKLALIKKVCGVGVGWGGGGAEGGCLQHGLQHGLHSDKLCTQHRLHLLLEAYTFY